MCTHALNIYMCYYVYMCMCLDESSSDHFVHTRVDAYISSTYVYMHVCTYVQRYIYIN